MGNYFGLLTGTSKSQHTIDNIIEDIVRDEDYRTYQIMFGNLYPRKDVYIDDNNNLRIETVMDEISNEYLYSEYSFDWNKPNIKEDILTILKRVYQIYKDRQNINHPNIPTQDHPAIDFIRDSFTDECEWDEWLDLYFYRDSSGYEMLKQDYENKNLETSLCDIWGYMISCSLENNDIYAKSVDGVAEIRGLCSKYEDVVIVTDQNNINQNNINQNNRSLAYLALIEGEWWYIGIDEKYCIEHFNP